MDVLRVSIMSYSWPRTIVLDHGVSTAPVHPSRGIVAGSSFATFELAVFLLSAMREMQQHHPTATLSLFVDDLTFDVIADTAREAVQAAVAVGNEAQQLIRTGLGLPFAEDKAVTLASIPGRPERGAQGLRAP